MNVDALLQQFRTDLDAAADPAAVEEVRRTHTGKKSPIKAAFKELRNVAPEERSTVAAALNSANETITAELEQATKSIEAKALADQLNAEWEDLTMPGQTTRRGARHHPTPPLLAPHLPLPT